MLDQRRLALPFDPAGQVSIGVKNPWESIRPCASFSNNEGSPQEELYRFHGGLLCQRLQTIIMLNSTS